MPTSLLHLTLARYPSDDGDRTLLDTLALWLGLWAHLQMQFIELLVINQCGRSHQQILRTLRLGEGNYFANVILVGEEHNQAVDTQGDATVGGRAILKGL